MHLTKLTTPEDSATVNLAVDTHSGFALLTLSGPITTATMGLAFRSLLRHRDYSQRMPAVWDFTNASSSMDPVALHQIATFLSAREDRHHTKIAIVVVGNLQRSLSRMYDAIAASDVPQTRQLFTNVYAAIGWVLPIAA